MPIHIQRVRFEISSEKHSGFHVGGPLLIPNFVYVIKTNFMHHSSSVYLINQPLHVSGIFVAHHQEECCIYTTIGTCCAFQLIVCWPGQLKTHSASNWFLSHIYIYIYRVARSTERKITCLNCKVPTKITETH